MSIYYYLEDKYALSRVSERYRKLLGTLRHRAVALEQLRRNGTQSVFAYDVTQADLEAVVNRITTEMRGMSPELNKKLQAMRAELPEYLKRTLPTHNNETLNKDLKNFRNDLYELHRMGDPDEGVIQWCNEDLPQSCQPFAQIIAGPWKQFLVEAIDEIEYELKRRGDRDPAMAKLHDLTVEAERLRTENASLKDQNRVLNEANLDLRQELESAMQERGSAHERLADKLLANVKDAMNAERRIRQQWEEEVRKAPPDRKKDIDRLFKTILDQFREEL